MTAHPKTDPVTGELLFFGYSPFPPYLRFHVADASGRLVTSVPVDLPAPVMMHDFAVSGHHVVFFDLPAVFDLAALLAGEPGIRWEPGNGARIGVLDRRSPHEPVRWFEVEPFWMFHVLNAHDEVGPAGEVVVVEGCRTDRLNVTFDRTGPGAGAGSGAAPAGPSLHRWRLDLASGRVSDAALDDRPADFPRLRDDRAGLDAHFGYVTHTRAWGGGEVEFDGVTKHHLLTGGSVVHRYGPTEVGGEAAFAPDPDRGGEDGGWLLNFVTDKSDGTSALVIVDAEAMEEVARVHLPRRVPSGFHGTWLAADGDDATGA
jgi:carotenoid cleavage dioxygenase